MDPKIILIIALLLFGWYWYANPDKGYEIIDQGVDKVQGMISGNKTAECPTTYDPVCAEGTEYDNSCLAQKAGHTNMTLGVCG